MNDNHDSVALRIAPEVAETEAAARLREQFHSDAPEDASVLRLDSEGLTLCSDGQELRGDFSRLLPRLKGGVSKEFLVRAAKIKNADGPLTAIDATAGLGEDSFFLAAAGFHVTLYERNPVIYALLRDALERAARDPQLAEIAGRMTAVHGNSIEAMPQADPAPDVVLLDPMFPARQKSALVKKKLQMIQKLEFPCLDEQEMMLAAMQAKPKKLIIKRPPKGPHLAGINPDHSIEGKAVRFDCIVNPYDRIHKFFD